MEFLIGNTGFVGSNLINSHKFSHTFNSSNISSAFGQNPDLLIYSGVKAEKFIANNNPTYDKKHIGDSINNIKKINPKKLILISTIDVYPKPQNVDEDFNIKPDNLLPYGYNRLLLENWVETNIKDYTIIRLPALYGQNIKKNFIFDIINFIPSVLSKDKMEYLSKKDSTLNKFYKDQNNGFFKCIEVDNNEKQKLKECFSKLNFSALNFTDSNAMFQFYNLSYLWDHINIAIKEKIKKLNLATNPIAASELYKYIFNKDFSNILSDNPPNYNFKSKYYKIFNGSNGYIFDKDFILNDIKNFIKQYN